MFHLQRIISLTINPWKNGKLGETIRQCQISHSQFKHDCRNAKAAEGGSKQINLHHPYSGTICMF